MKNKKLLFALSLASILTTVSVASCGATGLANVDFEVPEGGFDTETPVEITFYSTMGDALQKTFNVYLEEFHELYPNITVNHEQPGSYDDVRDQIKTELSNGLHPNLAYCYPDHVALYNKAKGVIALDKLIKDREYGLTREQQDDFIEGYWNEGKQFGDGKMYTLPFSKSTEVLYYNKTFFDANNLKVPTTWDEMEEVCAKILTIDNDCYPLGYDSEANWFITMAEQYGADYTSAKADEKADHFLFDNEKNRAFVERFNEWYKKGYFTTQKIYGSYTSGLFVEAADKTNSYMSIGSSAGAKHQTPTADDQGKRPFEVGIASIPQVDAAHGKVISQGPSVCIFNDEDPQKVMASWLLLKYLTTSVEFQAQFSIDSGYVPVLKSVAENDIFKDHLKKANGGDGVTALSAKVCMEQQSWYYTSPAFVGSSEARDQVGELLVSVFSGTKTVDEAFKYAVEMCIANS